MKPPKPTQNILRLYATLLRHSGPHYALELSEQSRISIGTIYSLVARLETTGLLTSTLEDVDAALVGRPARRYYTFTSTGLQTAREELAAAQRALNVTGPIPQGLNHA